MVLIYTNIPFSINIFVKTFSHARILVEILSKEMFPFVALIIYSYRNENHITLPIQKSAVGLGYGKLGQGSMCILGERAGGGKGGIWSYFHMLLSFELQLFIFGLVCRFLSIKQYIVYNWLE